MLTKQQICKLNDVEPTENVLKAMDEWGKNEAKVAILLGVAIGGLSGIAFTIISINFY